MSRLSRDIWEIHPNWINHFNDAAWNGRSFTQLLGQSVEMLNNAFDGERKIFHNAFSLFSQNPPIGRFIFTEDDIRWNLSGNFKYHEPIYDYPAPGQIIIDPDGIPFPIIGYTERLIFAGMDDDFGLTTNAMAPINGNLIRINYQRFIDFANDDPQLFPIDNGHISEEDLARGFQRFNIILGKTILHEIMHNHGFRHITRPNIEYDPSNEYWRSLPEVAEQAYFLCYQNTLFKDMNTIFNLINNSMELGCCGNVD